MSNGEHSGMVASFLGSLWQRVARCPRGKHTRSLKKVHKQGETYVSRCRGCGVAMVRKSKRNWVVDTRSS